jgi:hypothetical protein
MERRVSTRRLNRGALRARRARISIVYSESEVKHPMSGRK